MTALIEAIKKAKMKVVYSGKPLIEPSFISVCEAEVILSEAKIRKLLTKDLVDLAFFTTYDLFKDHNGTDAHKKYFFETVYNDLVLAWAVRKNREKAVTMRGSFIVENFEEIKNLITLEYD